MNENFIPVEGHGDLVRDKRSKAILNTNEDAFQKFKINRERLRNLDSVAKEHEELKKEFKEIKELLQKLLDKA